MSSFYDKLLKFVLEGGEISDERENKEISQCFTKLAIFTYILIMLSMIASIIIDNIYSNNSIATIFFVLIFIYMSSYISIKTRKYSLAQINIYSEAEYKKRIKKLKVLSLFNGLYFGLGMFLFMKVMYKYFQGIDGNISMLNITLYVVFGLPFGIVSYYLKKSKLNKEY